MIRMDVAEQLTDEGFQVFEAANADQAIARLEAEPSIRIMFTDITMPGTMDGLRLAAAVHDRWPPIKIVVTSALHLMNSTDIPDGSVFHAKPYQHDAIVKVIRRLAAM